MDDEFLHDAFERGSPAWVAMEGLTKGHEIKLPGGHSFVDYAGVERFEVRTKWWHEEPRSFRDVAIVECGQEHRVPDIPLPECQGAPVAERGWISQKNEDESLTRFIEENSCLTDGEALVV